MCSLLVSEDEVEGFSCQVLKLGRAPPFLLDRKLSSALFHVLKKRRRWSGALAPNYEKEEFSSCRQRGKQSARGSLLLPRGKGAVFFLG